MTPHPGEHQPEELTPEELRQFMAEEAASTGKPAAVPPPVDPQDEAAQIQSLLAGVREGEPQTQVPEVTLADAHAALGAASPAHHDLGSAVAALHADYGITDLKLTDEDRLRYFDAVVDNAEFEEDVTVVIAGKKVTCRFRSPTVGQRKAAMAFIAHKPTTMTIPSVQKSSMLFMLLSVNNKDPLLEFRDKLGGITADEEHWPLIDKISVDVFDSMHELRYGTILRAWQVFEAKLLQLQREMLKENFCSPAARP